MLNIVLVENCNLKCTYCLESEYQGSNKIITLDNFQTILKFLTKEKNKIFSLMGGEPLVHPNIKEILILSQNFFNEYHTLGFLFTNGIYLEQYLEYIPEQMGLLINCNPIDEIGEQNYTKLLSSIDTCMNTPELRYKTNLGINLHLSRTNYNYIWDIVDKYNIKILRCSITSPGRCYHEYYTNSDQYFQKMKSIFLDFVKQADNHNISLNQDCGYIPPCFFQEEEFTLVKKICGDNYFSYCHGYSADIFPDLTASFCFACDNSYNMLDFDNVEELYETLIIEQQHAKAKSRSFDRCKNCTLQNNCGQGCLSFIK